LAPAKSIAVLPFANLSEDKDANAFFADGMHDELLSALARISALKVISRTSVLAYRDPAKQRNLRQIADELGVASILEGSVSRSGKSVRIIVQLIDAATDMHRWTETYNLKEVTDVFQVQADIAAKIAGSLAATISPAEKAALATKPTNNPEAYDLYLKGRGTFDMGYLTRGRARFDEAITQPLEQAVALDPSFAAAWAALGEAYLQLHGRFDQTPERLAQAKDAIDRAWRLDAKLAEVHLALGNYYGNGLGDWQRAVEQVANALALAPGNGEAISELGTAQLRLGRWSEGVANLERSATLDPQRLNLSSHGFVMTLGLVAQRLYRKAEALRAQTRRQSSNPSFIDRSNSRLTLRYLLDGDRVRYTSAVAELASSEEATETRWKYRLAMMDGRFADAARLPLVDEGASDIVRGFQTINYCRATWLAGDRAGAQAAAASVLAMQRAPTPEARGSLRSQLNRAMLHAFAGEIEPARKLADAAVAAVPLSRDAIDGPEALVGAAEIYLVLGEHDHALELLESALSVPSPVLMSGHPDLEPLWAPLWQKSRYKAAMAKMKSLD
jgi:TolB-like protein/Tfp pilus assembly protein PilF